MARPIKETPVLTGRDAARFAKNIAESEKTKLSRTEMERMRENFNKFKLVD
ncbi:hypothetical protein [Runella rosea]|uniref:hypothetical protein n=1 Tax=Runella rosea TaxID=2259595 RepID=UPI001962634B|nr:hypothetical protein [Runella rosea]